MASYPNSVKSFSTKVDGPTEIIGASHVNDLQDEVTAIETGLLNGLSHALNTGSTGQIVFPATQNASSGANTLDDYEEGSWTPVLGGASSTSGQTYTTAVGRYVKVGKLVTCQFAIELSVKGTITGNCQIQGLPFTSENTSGLISVASLLYANLATTWVNVVARVELNGTVASVLGTQAAADDNADPLDTNDIANNSLLQGTLIYRAAN